MTYEIELTLIHSHQVKDSAYVFNHTQSLFIPITASCYNDYCTCDRAVSVVK